MSAVFMVKRNSDLTEGRGPKIAVGLFSSEENAHRYVTSNDSPYMGFEIWREGVSQTSNLHELREKIWGYRKDTAGRWANGWLDLRDEPENDPEYQEFLRLKEKFGA